MKNGALFLLIILLLSLVLCSVLGGKNCSEGYMGNGKVTKGKESFSLGNLTGVFNKKKEKFSLLGGSYDNYEHFTGSSVPTTYTGSNGSATVSYENGTYTINVTDNSGSTTVYSVDTNNNSSSTTGSDSITKTIFTGPNGGSATVYTDDDDKYIVKVYNANTGSISIYTSTNGSGTTSSTTNTSSSTSYSTTNDNITATTYYGPNGSARVIKNSSTGQYAVEVTGPNGEKVVYSSNTNTIYTNGSNSLEGTTYIGPNGTATIVKGDNGQYVVKISDNYGNVVVYDSRTNTAYTNTNGTSDPYYYNGNNYTYTNTSSGNASAGAVSGQYGNAAFYATGPNGNTVAGVSGSSIPPGDEDLYILKSQIVPPVCPACPSAASCPRQEPCPACPACARCPEPAFECKKVPNYNNINDNYLPMPVLSDFSTFGM